MKENLVSAVQRLIVQGYGKADVEEWLKKEHPKQKTDEIYKTAVDFFTEHAMTKSARLGFCQEASRLLYQKMLYVGDYPGALRATQELARLSNAYETAKSEDEPALPKQETADHKDSKELLRLIRNGDAS